MANPHDVRVVTCLTADEFFSMQTMADSEGMTQSAFIRHLLRLEARRRAMAQVSEQQRLHAIEEPAQVVRSGGAGT
ncbi:MULTISPECIES: hypothetical protein [Giesbergeria]|uniref:Uncharacterized protein n=1 Tax=Giesbergeria sinuosa TaxID=80883 RepID=A0ABV9QFX1_9BURK